MPYVVSTHSSDVEYVNWQSVPGGINLRKPFANGKSSVIIKGGHGVAQRSGTMGLHTPNGVVTKISDEELAFLMTDQTFLQHKESGGVKIVKSKPDGAEVAADMATSPDTPLTAKDFQKGGRVSTADRIKVNGGRALQ